MALIAPASTNPTSSSPLNFFFSVNFFLMMGHPNRCCIFKFRPDQSLDAAALVSLGAKAIFLRKKPSVLVALLAISLIC